MKTYVTAWEVLWYPACTSFSNPVGHGQCCAHYQWNIQLLGTVSQLNVSVLSDKGIGISHIFRSGGHALVCRSLSSTSVLPILKALHHIHICF